MCKQDRINLKNNDDENQFSLNKLSEEEKYQKRLNLLFMPGKVKFFD